MKTYFTHRSYYAWIWRVGIFIGFLLILSTLFMVFCRDGVTHFHGISQDSDKSTIGAFFNRLYFSTVTVTTVGYGDITPKSIVARTITMIAIFIVLFEVVVIVSHVVSK